MFTVLSSSLASPGNKQYSNSHQKLFSLRSDSVEVSYNLNGKLFQGQKGNPYHERVESIDDFNEKMCN